MHRLDDTMILGFNTVKAKEEEDKTHKDFQDRIAHRGPSQEVCTYPTHATRILFLFVVHFAYLLLHTYTLTHSDVRKVMKCIIMPHKGLDQCCFVYLCASFQNVRG